MPADAERKLAKAADTAADALIIDLEDAVAAERRPAARELMKGGLPDYGDKDVWIRINPLDGGEAEADLDAAMTARPTGIVLPKAAGAGDIDQLATLLDQQERSQGLDAGQTRILPIVTERPAALFQLQGYAATSPRLAGLTWGAEDLGVAVGATETRAADGSWLAPYELARSLCLFAAHAAKVAAVDTVFTDFRDSEGLAKYVASARRDGFDGMLAIHPVQVDTINAGFLPSADEVDRAQRIVALFDANPEAGALGMDGEMIDRPHWLQAKKILDKAKKYR